VLTFAFATQYYGPVLFPTILSTSLRLTSDIQCTVLQSHVTVYASACSMQAVHTCSVCMQRMHAVACSICTSVACSVCSVCKQLHAVYAYTVCIGFMYRSLSHAYVLQQLLVYSQAFVLSLSLFLFHTHTYTHTHAHTHTHSLPLSLSLSLSHSHSLFSHIMLLQVEPGSGLRG